MLLEFRVTNYRSFRDETILRMTASSDASMERTHTHRTGLEKAKRALTSAAIYGANASGKTNVIRALQFMALMVTTSNQIQPEQESNLTPFSMREGAQSYPTIFEATFVIESKRYQYGFELTRRVVNAEWLLVYETSKPQEWFSRTRDEKTGKYKYRYSDYFSGPKKVWEGATRKEVLFLTTAVNLNNEQLRPLYQKFSEDMAVLPNGGSIGVDFTANFVSDSKNEQRVVSLIAAADTGISSLSLDKKKGKHLQVNFLTGTHETADVDIDMPQFGHKAGGVVYPLEFTDESSGTQIIFSLAGPLLDILQQGRLLVVDELDRSLHPLLVQKIVGMFNDPETNPHGAQLIFTTHDVSLLDGGHLRRDQIWFTEKDLEQVSHLYPLIDFSPRKTEALERGYLGGRYGGIPILQPLKS
jgi:AAA15 family ATPase/GTPase